MAGTGPHQLVLLGALSLLSGACEPEPVVCGEPPSYVDADRETTFPFLLRCEVAPELCGLSVHSTIREPELGRAIDLVFVGDGYPEASLDDLEAHVNELIEGMQGETGSIVARAPALFNVHFVRLTSPGRGPGAGRLGTCVERDKLLDGTWMLRQDNDRVARAAANAPDADVVVAIRAGTHGRANTGDELAVGDTGESTAFAKLIALHEDHSHRVLTHELGHALVELADEYSDADARYPDADTFALLSMNPLRSANVSLHPQGDWDGLVQGAIEGGARYRHGIYHPTDHCRMLDSDHDPFCPVCSAAIDQFLAARRGLQDGPPDCALGVLAPLLLPQIGVRAVARDNNMLDRFELIVDHGVPRSLLFPPDRDKKKQEETDIGVMGASGTELELLCVDVLGAMTRTSLRIP